MPMGSPKSNTLCLHSKWITDSNVKKETNHKTFTTKQENYFQELGLGNEFLDLTPKEQSTRGKIKILDLIKI